MLSKQSLDILIDLVEIKLSSILVQDKDDIKEVRRLKNCKSELISSRKNHRSNTINNCGSKILTTGRL